MNVKYKNIEYKVTLKNALRIWYRKVLLWARRVKRFLLRMLEVFKKDLIVLLIAIIGYVLFVVVIQNMYTDYSILESIWSTRAEVFTVFGVVAFNAFISYERGWQKSIRNWYWTYLKYLMDCERDIGEMNQLAGLDKNEYVVTTNESFEKFKKENFESFSSDNIIDKNEFKKILNRIKDKNIELKNTVNKDEYYQYKYYFNCIYENFQHYLSSLNENLNEEEYFVTYKDILAVDQFIYEIVSIIRKLWRTEINLDNEIMEILNNCGYNVMRL